MGISDLIASFLQESLDESDGGVLEVQRSDLAQRFNCVPSQINYVMSTRFSPEPGYIVESRRKRIHPDHPRADGPADAFDARGQLRGRRAGSGLRQSDFEQPHHLRRAG